MCITPRVAVVRTLWTAAHKKHTYSSAQGRLDFNTEGLLLLTNDGDYARELEHPKSDVSRVYRAQVRGVVSESKIQELRRGPLVDGIKYRSIEVSVQSTDKKDSWLQVKLAEGKVR